MIQKQLYPWFAIRKENKTGDKVEGDGNSLQHIHQIKMLTCWFPSLGHPYLFPLWHQNCVGVSAQSASHQLSLE